MARLLLKDITRETLKQTDFKGNKIIVTLKAGDMLEFRSRKSKHRFEVPLGACYNLALIYSASIHYKEKLDKYNEARKNGQRKRRPKPYPRIFNPKLYQALLVK